MSGQTPAAAPAAPVAAGWNEYRSPDGRIYYHNSATNITQWTKPEDMMTPVERALLKHDTIATDKERAKERMTKLRADFATMLKSHPEIKHYTHWRTARPIIEGETIFRSTNSEAERRQLFDDYIDDLRRVHREQKTAVRKSAMDGLIALLPQLQLQPYTRWAEARPIIEATPPLQNDEKYKSLSKFDVLTVFQNHMKGLERAFNDSRQNEKNSKYRRERKNREAFAALLGDLAREGKIKAGSKWSCIAAM